MATSRAGRGAADAIVRSLTERVRQMRLVLAPPTPEVMEAALAVRARYASMDLDLVDAVNVALAAEYGTDAILTRDLRDFRALRPTGADTPASGSSPTISDRSSTSQAPACSVSSRCSGSVARFRYSCTAQPLPSGSVKYMKVAPSASEYRTGSETSRPRATRSAWAFSMSATTSWRPW